MGITEKRKSPRVIADLVTVEIFVHTPTLSESEILEICAVANISETGMLFISSAPFDPGDILRLTFALPDSLIVIRTDAIVIHSAKRNGYRIGVQYKNLAIAEQKLLRHFITKSIRSFVSEG